MKHFLIYALAAVLLVTMIGHFAAAKTVDPDLTAPLERTAVVAVQAQDGSEAAEPSVVMLGLLQAEMSSMDDVYFRNSLKESLGDSFEVHCLETPENGSDQMAMFQKIGEFKLAYPTGDKITKDDLVKADVAMYVIARQAGEGDDRKLEKGDYLLSDLEKENIDLLAKTYRKVILVINAGSIIDIAPIEHEVQAIVYLGQPGEEGGNALGEIVSGKVSPSGKLTDTWGRTYADYPAAAFRQDEKLEEDYYEGIYVGYRYFEAKGHRPLYPFGYGLSYTTFNMAYQSLEVDGSFVRLHAKVTNVGTKAGKEVAELYLARPNRKLPGEKKFLVAYKKTKVLQPGEEEEVTLAFDLAKVGAYDEKESRFFLEEGSYGLYLGGDVLEAKPVAVLFLKEDIITEIV